MWMHSSDSALQKSVDFGSVTTTVLHFISSLSLTPKVFLFSYQSVTVKGCKQELWKQRYQIFQVHLL